MTLKNCEQLGLEPESIPTLQGLTALANNSTGEIIQAILLASIAISLKKLINAQEQKG